LVAAGGAAATAAEGLRRADVCVARVAVDPELTARPARAALGGHLPGAKVVADILGAAATTTCNKLDGRSQADRAKTTSPASPTAAAFAAAIEPTHGACSPDLDREYLARRQGA
jgi:hypothetical protein